MIKTDTALPAGPLETVARHLKRIDAIPPDGFVELAGFDSLTDGAAVEHDSRTWAERFLTPAANPYRQQTARARFVHHATNATHDTLRHHVQLEDARLQIDETVKVLLVRARLEDGALDGSDDDRVAATIAAVAGRLLRMTGSYDDAFGQAVPYHWTFHYHPPLGDGARFSSAPAADPAVLSSWTARIDGGIHQGTLFFLGHKVHVSGDGRLVFLSGRHWFDGECWRPYS